MICLICGQVSIRKKTPAFLYDGFHKWGIPNSWLVYKGDPTKMDDDWGYPYDSGKHHMSLLFLLYGFAIVSEACAGFKTFGLPVVFLLLLWFSKGRQRIGSAKGRAKLE